MRVLRKIISVCLLLGLMAMCLFCAGCDSPQGKINFSQKQKPSETTYVAGSSDNSERPLRIAFASVMSPRAMKCPMQ